MLSCPPLHVLSRIGTCLTGGSTDHAVDAHIDGCARCQHLMDGLAGRDALVETRAVVDTDTLPRVPGFTIERELGRGGMGVVFLARELHPDRDVAIKLLSCGPLAAPRDRDRWLREARALARVRHPHVVQLYQAGEACGWLYLVLEYLAGGSLREYLKGPLSPRVAVGLLVPVVDALEQLHRAGVWHLDLKPANILIDAAPGTPLERARLKVTDFGIARSRDEAAGTRFYVGAAGTLPYMAPEQLGGQRSAVGPATDVYATGVVLYELLVGRPPFLADDDAHAIRNIQSEDPVSPRRLNPSIARDLETIILNCLSKDPGRRYGSAEALAEDLRRWLDGRPILARQASAVERAYRWCRRHTVIAALLASLGMTLLCGFVASLSLWRYAEAQRVRAASERDLATADYEVSRAALAEIVQIGAASLEPAVVVTRDRVVALLQAARPRLGELDQRRPHDPGIWTMLANVDLILGRNLEYQSRWVEAEARFRESLSRWDRVVEEAPTEFAPAGRRWQTLECLGRVLAEQGKEGESARFFERAIVAGEAFLSMSPDAISMVGSLMDCRMSLATLVERQGDLERAVSLLEANIGMWSSVPDKAKTPVLADRVYRCWCERYRISCECEAVSAEDWARRAVDVLRLRSESPDGGVADVPEAAYLLQQSLQVRASYLRRSGDSGGARRIVDRMHCLGDLLVSTEPDRSAAYLSSSEAFRQSAKDAFHANDLTAAKLHWQRALDAAPRQVGRAPRRSSAASHRRSRATNDGLNRCTSVGFPKREIRRLRPPQTVNAR